MTTTTRAASVAFLGITLVACSSSSGTPPLTGSTSRGAADPDVQGVATAQNLPPVMRLNTFPPMDTTTHPHPTITGAAPLEVTFGLCNSSDPDVGDTLNYQFHFGDGRPIGEGPDFGHFCRAVHVYERPGRYTATVSVTDLHRDDQEEFTALARTNRHITIVVTGRSSGGGGGPAPAAPLRVFVSKANYPTTAFGSAAGADALCQASAGALGGTWLAWLSDSGTSPAARFTRNAAPYLLVDGTQVADNWGDLTDGSLDHAIDLDQDGLAALAPVVWTGTRVDGTADPLTCTDWTSTSFLDAGMAGLTGFADNNWTNNLGAPCAFAAHLYCFEQ
jgi:hypothetical protein